MKTSELLRFDAVEERQTQAAAVPYLGLAEELSLSPEELKLLWRATCEPAGWTLGSLREAVGLLLQLATVAERRRDTAAEVVGYGPSPFILRPEAAADAIREGADGALRAFTDLTDLFDEAAGRLTARTVCRISVGLYDGRGNLGERRTLPADEAGEFAKRFVISQGADPERRGSAQAGVIRFEPVSDDDEDERI